MKLLIVDSDRTQSDLTAYTFRQEGYSIVQAFEGEQALQQWAAERPDLIILDLNLSRRDGFAVCRHIRNNQDDTPIIILTERDEEVDILRAFAIGADDYVLKPFSPRQLLARCKAVLRRAKNRTDIKLVNQIGAISFDANRRQLRRPGETPVSLTALENRLLSYLLFHAGQIVSSEAIINYIWGSDGGDRDMLRQLVRRLRTKLEPDPAQTIYIETVPGLGYGLMTSTFFQRN